VFSAAIKVRPDLNLLISTAWCDVTQVKAIGIYYSVPMNIILMLNSAQVGNKQVLADLCLLCCSGNVKIGGL
jgi:hypothetical protein